MDDLDPQRKALAVAILSLKNYQGTAGSAEMRKVQSALEYCGCAYSCLETTGNPAWAG